MWNARLDEAQVGIKIAEININNLRYADDTILLRGSKEELKSLLMSVKQESEKAGLKQHSKSKDHGILSHHFMATRWGKNGNINRLFSWAPKSLQMVTADKKLTDIRSFEEKLWQT